MTAELDPRQITAVSRLFPDTTPDAVDILAQRLCSLSPMRKMQMMAELNANMRALARAGLRHRHPNADEGEVDRRLADLLLGPELAAEVYGPIDSAGLVGTDSTSTEDDGECLKP